MTPLVSCLMVTKAGREPMARVAIEAWQAQTYPLRELIVVADNPTAFTGVPKGVRLVEATRATLGGIRQQSVAAARGDLIAIWDDDDEYAPNRLASQVAVLDDADACVITRMTLVCVCGFETLSRERYWEPTLVARRAGLPHYHDVPHGEDEALIDDLKAKGARFAELEAPELYRYRFWGGNACAIEHWQDLFEASGSTHDLWKCASDRGLAEPERSETFDDLAKRIPQVTSPSGLTRVVAAVADFRARHGANGPCAEQRSRLAILVAAAYSAQGELDTAKTWALRSLHDGPRVDTLCMLGEIAAAEREHVAALAWYDAACAGRGKADHMIPVENRHQRRAELRTLVRPFRSVARQYAHPGHVLAVMTCAGRSESLRRTIGSLDRAGLSRWSGQKILVHDGRMDRVTAELATRLQDVGWNVRTNLSTPPGQAKTFLDVLRLTAEVPFAALTMFEDDVVLARNALDYIATTAIDSDLALISWFTIDPVKSPIEPPFLHVTASIDHRPSNAALTLPASTVEAVLARYRPSNQAITMPASTVNAILASDKLQAWPEEHGADRIFWEVPGTPCAIHYPNLVQHVGEQSMVGNVGERRSPSFIGEDVDALTLLD